jgi:hypothetical protein
MTMTETTKLRAMLPGNGDHSKHEVYDGYCYDCRAWLREEHAPITYLMHADAPCDCVIHRAGGDHD